MRSSLFLADEVPVNTEEFNEIPASNFYPLGRLADRRIVLHAAVGQAPLAEMVVLIYGTDTAWEWSDVPSLVPQLAAEILALPPHSWLGDT